jgi:ADP-heptose:LPS heptosyltransferase
MTTKKLLKQLNDLFELKKRKQCKRKDEIKKLLKQLRKKEHDLIDKLREEKSDNKRAKLKKHIQIVHAQRLKGLRTIKKISCED